MFKQAIIIGNTVTVEKGGEVIPKVTGNASECNLTEEELKVKVYESFAKNAEGAYICPCGLQSPLEKSGNLEILPR